MSVLTTKPKSRLRTILSHGYRAAGKYPTLTLLCVFLALSVLPRFLSVAGPLRGLASTPTGILAMWDPFGDDQSAIARARAERDQALERAAVAEALAADYRRRLVDLDRLSRIGPIRSYRDAAQRPLDVIDATVALSRDASPWRQSMVINVGTNDGIHPGDPVVKGRVLIGRIGTDVGPWTARVTLATDPGIRAIGVIVVPAGDAEMYWLGDNTRDASTVDGEPRETWLGPDEQTLSAYPRGIARGSSTSEFQIELHHFEQTAEVQVGDVVLTSHQSAIVPGGLIVGRVKQVTTSSRPRFKTVIVEPWGDSERLERVQVIRWPIQDLPSSDSIRQILSEATAPQQPTPAGEGSDNVDPAGRTEEEAE